MYMLNNINLDRELCTPDKFCKCKCKKHCNHVRTIMKNIANALRVSEGYRLSRKYMENSVLKTYAHMPFCFLDMLCNSVNLFKENS